MILGLFTALLYAPSLRHDFLSYDDQQYVTENPRVTSGLNWKGFIWSFGNHAGNWHPLTWLAHMLDCQLYGLNPAGHHLTNVLLHVANTVLLFLLLTQMTGKTWRSASVAALFGWHPLHVESVAWVAERKDVLCAFFWMLTLCTYAKQMTCELQAGGGSKEKSSSSATHHFSSWHWLSLLFYALALMSKPMAVTLPFVLLLLDFWPLQRVTMSNFRFRIWGLIREKLLFFALTAIACALTLSAQEQAIVSTAGLSIPQRLWHALVAYAHYVGALFAPHGLAVHYPYEDVIPLRRIILAGSFVAIATIVALWFIRRRPYIAIGWLWYLGTLVPVIGLVQVGDQAWADRYTYLPLIGLFLIVVWGISDVVRQPQVLAGFATAAGLALLAGTALQLRYWQNTRILFTHAAKAVPNNYMAITMLGSLLAKDNKLDEAITHYRTALQLKPDYPEAHFFLGNAFDQQGKLDEAIAEYQKALWFKPATEPAHVLLGIALGKKGQSEEAAAHFLGAIKFNPDSAVAHNNLARIRHTQGRLDDAIVHYTIAVKVDPNLAQAHNNLGVILLQKGRLAEGTAALRESLRLNSTNAETQVNLAFALNQQNQWAEATDLFAKSVTPSDRNPNALYQFGLALYHMGKTREAMSHYASALLIQSDFAESLDGLAWILCTSTNSDFRNAAQSLGMAQRACELTDHRNPRYLRTLSAAYAECGRFEEAIAAIESAKASATNSNDRAMLIECEQMLAAFNSSKPWRTNPNTVH